MDDKQGPPPAYNDGSSGIANPAFSSPSSSSAWPASQAFAPAAPGQYTTAGMAPQSAMFHGQSNVYVSQPGVAVAGYAAITTVPDYMGLAVFATFCCCLPIGIFAIMKASESREHLGRNDVNMAMLAANESRRLSYIAIGLGSVVLVGAIIALIVIFTTLSPFY